jgi:enolase
MIEYYSKMITDHPLLSYIEDALSQFDFAAHRQFKEHLGENFPQVKMGLRQLFTKGLI